MELKGGGKFYDLSGGRVDFTELIEALNKLSNDEERQEIEDVDKTDNRSW